VALCGSSAAPGEAIFARPTFPRLLATTPPGLQVPEVRLGGVGVLKSVKNTELCSFDSESSEKKILLIKYVFLLRSSRVLNRWLCLSPLNTDHTVRGLGGGMNSEL
jgi:hypothetical protein